MNVEEIREHCISKNDVEESFPFGEETLVFKVKGKMFLLLDLNSNPPEFNVKCNPDKAIELREKYNNVKPGYHMNKKHWNTIVADSTVQTKTILSWIDDSYSLVLEGAPKNTGSQKLK